MLLLGECARINAQHAARTAHIIIIICSVNLRIHCMRLSSHTHTQTHEKWEWHTSYDGCVQCAPTRKANAERARTYAEFIGYAVAPCTRTDRLYTTTIRGVHPSLMSRRAASSAIIYCDADSHARASCTPDVIWRRGGVARSRTTTQRPPMVLARLCIALRVH